MRLHTLTITAVGPFATTEVIDFDRLTRGGLFLLEGPTGAGKSTVLDALTFALFGSPAGESTSADRMHSHFAAPGTSPEVVLEFSVRGDRLRITRSPDYQRRKLRGEGFTTERSRVHLQRAVGADQWSTLSTSAQEAGAEVQRVLGLNREQFTKVVLLPQGEFATFLRAKDDVRRSVLTQIFGTAFYDDVTRLLETWRRDAGRERGAADDEVTRALAALGAAAGLDPESDTALQTSAGNPEHLDAVAESLAEAARLAAAAETAATQTHADSEAAQQRLLALVEAHRAHADYLLRRTAHDSRTGSHADRLAELRAARAAAPVGVVLGQLTGAESHVERAREAVAALSLDTNTEVADTEHPDADPERLDTEHPDPEHLERQARADDSTAAALGATATLEAGLAARSTAVDGLASRIAATRAEIDTIVERRGEVPALLADLAVRIDSLTRQAGTLPSLTADKARADERLTAARELVVVTADLATAAADAAGAERAHLDARGAHLDLLERHLAGMAADLAGRLADGEPCPVCGSPDHPAPARPGDDHVTRDAVDTASAAEDQSKGALDVATARVHELTAKRAALDVTSGGLDVTAAELAVRAAADALTEVERAGRDLDIARADHLRLEAELAESAEVESERRAALAVLEAEHVAATAALTADQATVTEARDGRPSVAARIAALGTRAEKARARAAALTTLAHARAALLDKRNEADTAAVAAGFAGLDTAAAAVRSAPDIAALETAIKSWDDEAAALRELAVDPRFAGLLPTDAQRVAEQLVAATAATAEAERVLADTRRTHTQAQAHRSAFGTHRARLVTTLAERDSVHTRTRPITRMADLAKGHSGNLRMSLSTYVLRHWFASVVDAANLRLDRMSAGRYQLERTDDTERKTDQAGLGLKVIDRHTGEARSPKSLSGGETFYTSLALALGLADVVIAEAGGVDLDTLFIDEGFGTLDAETLDLVMAVIDNLRVDGRAVGIVSHVADLKDQITERLEVRRTHPQGPSTTRVIA